MPARATPFRIMDCAVTTLAPGRSAQNLREFRDGVAEVPAGSIAHHFYESLLRPVFDDPEYRNDFAVWARRHLHDNQLSERLGAIDPMRFPDIESVRQHLLDVIEDRLSESLLVPSAAPGHEFYFLSSRMVIFDTGNSARNPRELASRLPRLSTGSVYYHFVEGRRRPPLLDDDFSVWLSEWGPRYDACRASIAGIDYHLWSLTEMRALLARCLQVVPPDEGGA